MPRPSKPFNDGSIDPFLSPMGHESLHQGHLDDVLSTTKQGHPTFSPANSEVLEDFRLGLHGGSIAQNDSETTTASTPHFTGYTFGQRPSPNSQYPPTPTPKSPHLYPLQLQQFLDPRYPHQQQRHLHHPLPVRSQTSTSFLRPSHHHTISRIYQPHHRRSLSQGDADRISAATNPVFFRLQAPRACSIAPEDESCRLRKRIEPYQKGPRSSSQGSGMRKARIGTPRSMPFDIIGANRAYGVLPTPIGTPLSESESGGEGKKRGDVRFAYMNRGEQVRESVRVIEIGAMAVLQVRKRDEDAGEGGMDGKGSMLRKLEDLEWHLRHEMGVGDEGLRGCEMIRGVLAKERGDQLKDGMYQVVCSDNDDGNDNKPKAMVPSDNLFGTVEKSKLYTGTTDDELFTMLAKDMDAKPAINNM